MTPQEAIDILYRAVPEAISENYELPLLIGRVKEAIEKQKPKKPDYEGDSYDNEGNLIYDTWICPNCGCKDYEVDYDDFEYCPKCGQALMWETEE